MAQTPAVAAVDPAPISIESERAARLFIVGTPALAEQTTRMLPAGWQVTLVGEDIEHAADAGYRTVRGDPTSALALRRAGADAARALVAALADPEENTEVCRVACQELRVPSVIALAYSIEEEQRLRLLGAEALSLPQLVATAVRNQVERASAAAQGVGLGQGEIVEIVLQASSPVVGRRLRALRPTGWAPAALFRDGELLLPTPDLVLRPDDHLLLVGDPERLRVIAEYLRVGRPQFPLPYGNMLAGPVWGEPSASLLREAAYFAQALGLDRVTLLSCTDHEPWQRLASELDLAVPIRWRRSELTPADAVDEALKAPSLGCLIVPPSRARLPRPFAGVAQPLARALAHASVPVLVPRGSFPYERLLLPVVRTPLPGGAVQAALDLAEQLSAELTTVHVEAPGFLEEHGDEAAVVAAAVDEMAAVRRRMVTHTRVVGNPLSELERTTAPRQLAVFSHRRGRRWRGLRPDVSAFLAQRYRGSALIVPLDPA